MKANPVGFYHSEKLQSTKTDAASYPRSSEFYHSEKLQSTKTGVLVTVDDTGFIIAKNYRVLKPIKK